MTTDAWSEITDPATTPERLAELAAAHPEFAAQISAHPNAYPALREWIATYAAPAVAAQPVATPSGPREPVASRRRGRRRLVTGIAIGTVAVVLIGGGVGGWWLFSRFGGAASPEAAVERLIAGGVGMDPLSVFGALAPSEVSALQGSVQELTAARTDVENGIRAQDALAELRGALVITTEEMEFDAEEIAEGVTRVSWIDGSITIDGDPDEIARIIVQNGAYDAVLPDDRDVREARDEIERSLAGWFDFPFTVSAREVEATLGWELSTVTVHEGTGWYVSPLLTAADATYLQTRASADESIARLGDEIMTARHYDTPEDAATALAEAALDGDVDAVAAALPLAERRLVSLYGDWLVDPYDQHGGAPWASAQSIQLRSAKFSSLIDGDLARLTIDEFATESVAFDSSVGRDLVDTFTLDGQCYDMVDEWTTDDGYWDEGERWWESDEWVENWVVDQSRRTGCLDDVPVFRRLGVDDMAVIAVRENGGWLVSPVASVADAAEIATARFIEYYEDGRLAELSAY